MEARHSKSMDSYELLARFCSKESVAKLVLPLKEVRADLRREGQDVVVFRVRPAAGNP